MDASVGRVAPTAKGHTPGLYTRRSAPVAELVDAQG
jgi:hypothetical protein